MIFNFSNSRSVLYIFFVVIVFKLLSHPSASEAAVSIESNTGRTKIKKAITMNIHCFKNNWKTRLAHILDVIVATSPEVVAFQEVCVGEESQIDFIRDYLRNSGYPLAGELNQFTHRAWNTYDEYISIFSKVEPQGASKGLLPESPLRRGYTALKIDQIWFINIHLEHRSDYAHFRKKQISYLIKMFNGHAHIFLGDFNSSPRSDEQSLFMDAAYYLYFPGATYIGDNLEQDKDIDGFWLSPAVFNKLKTSKAKIIMNQKVNGNYLSDHFGVEFSYSFSLP